MKNKTLFILLAILAIGIFFRVYKLNSIPPGLYPDIAMNGNDALDSLKSGVFKVFYPENNGREGLFMWLIAASFKIFGVSILSIKIAAVSIGILTLLGLYLFTTEFVILIGSRLNEKAKKAIPLLSTFFFAISFWHNNFSRMGFRIILFPFVLVFSFYFLLKAFRTKKISNFVFSGLIFGLGFYTYTGFRFSVLLLFYILAMWWILNRKRIGIKEYSLLLLALIFSIFLIALPIGLYFLSHPADFIGRASQVSILSQKSPVGAFAISLVKHLGMFDVKGDLNWRHNLSDSPMLIWPVGLLFLIGIGFSLKELIVSIKQKSSILFLAFSSLFVAFFITLLSATLTYEGIPHALRAFGVIPVVYIFVGLGAWEAYDFFDRNADNKRLLYVAAAFFIIAASMAEFKKYFVLWGENPILDGAFTANYVREADYLNSLPDSTKRYVIVNEGGIPVPWPNGIPMPSQTIIFLERAKYGNVKSIYLTAGDIIKIDPENRPTVVLPMAFDEKIFQDLMAKFPNGYVQVENNLTIFKINFK